MSDPSAESLETSARKHLRNWDFRAAIADAGRALAIREATQGPRHPGLIWPLSIWIGALLRDHKLAQTKAAATLGLRRLALQEVALAAFPDARADAIREQIALYAFEGEVFDAAGVRALEGVLKGYPWSGHGG